MASIAVSDRASILMAQIITRFLHETAFQIYYALIIVNSILNFFNAFNAWG